MAQFRVNGLNFEVESLGDPARPTILLIMGLGMQLTAWPDEFCQMLVEGGYRVVRFDNRDIGLSSKLDAARVSVPLAAMRYWLRLSIAAPYRIEDLAQDALGVLDALKIRVAHIVGASMGGMIAQNLAASHPRRCLSLTSIMSTSGDRGLPMARPKVIRQLIARPPRRAPIDVVVGHYVRLFQTLGGPGFPMPEERLRERMRASLQRSYSPEGTTRQLLAIVSSGDRSRLLRSIAVPTLVLHGDADPLVPVAHGHDCARKIPGAKLEIIKGMGHDLPPDLLPLLRDAVLQHVRSVEASSRSH